MLTGILFVGAVALTTAIYYILIADRSKKKDLEQTFNTGECLHPVEKGFLVKNSLCPDCKEGRLLENFSSDVVVQVRCSKGHCGSRFRIYMDLYVERISHRSPYMKLPKPELPGHNPQGEYR